MWRLWQRGKEEEDQLIRWLELAGIKFAESLREDQFRVNFGSHVSGSMDGIILSGVPEAPNKSHIVEMKTHKDSSFKDLLKNGLKKSKPQHETQCQVYMFGMGIDRALYIAVNKDNDALYTERVRLDSVCAQRAVDRGKRIALSDRIPNGCAGASSTWYLCKMCDYYEFCHETHKTNRVTCRNCAHSTAKPNSTWTCVRWGNVLIPQDVAVQVAGCSNHVLHPDVVPWPLVRKENPNEAVYEIDGQLYTNGCLSTGAATSRELIEWA